MSAPQPDHVTLWYVEYCANDAGLWARHWYATEAEANEGYAEACAQFGWTGEDEDLDGEYGQVQSPASVVVAVTCDGILEFARDHASAAGEGI